jgi:predicted ester cyclase
LAEVGVKPTDGESIKQFRRQFGAEFSKIKIDVEDVVTTGDRIAARCLVDVTHATTGKRAVFGGMCFVHMKDGKIGAAWNNFDFASMRQQLA